MLRALSRGTTRAMDGVVSRSEAPGRFWGHILIDAVGAVLLLYLAFSFWTD